MGTFNASFRGLSERRTAPAGIMRLSERREVMRDEAAENLAHQATAQHTTIRVQVAQTAQDTAAFPPTQGNTAQSRIMNTAIFTITIFKTRIPPGFAD
jgi:hypothetical protein